MTNNRKGKKTAYVLNFLIALCIMVTIICAAGAIYELYTRRQGQTYYSALSVVAQKRPPAAPEAKAKAPESNVAAVSEAPEEQEPVETVWMPYIDFNAAKELIPDLAAWIYCEGTVIDYPIVRGEDNHFYLYHLPDKTRNGMGSIFLDYRNSTDFSDKNSVIYGHHMKTNDMFTPLENYKEQSFYDAHPIIELYTAEKDYIVEVFAGCVVSGAQKSLPLEFEEDGSFESYIEELRRDSVFKSEVEVGADDRIVTLCTCTYNFKNARFLVIGKLTPVGE